MSPVRDSFAIAVFASLSGVATGFSSHDRGGSQSDGAVAVARVSVSVARRWDVAPNVAEGTVTTTDGRPVPGATIRLTSSTRGDTIKSTTDQAGRYRVTVPPGEYAVDGSVDIAYNGRTYRDFWLDPVNSGCERLRSEQGIVRNFVLRLSGLKRCVQDSNPANPGSYNGANISALSPGIPDDAIVTVSLTPVGPLADGTTGGTVTFTRSGAALRSSNGPLDQTADLYDIPLGRYRATANARYADGTQHDVRIALSGSEVSAASSVEIAFDPNAQGGGIRPATLSLSADLAASASAPRTPSVVPTSPAAPAPAEKSPSENPPGYAELPVGRYACSDYSQPVGEFSTPKAIIILAGGHYQGFGGTGGYIFDSAKESVRWTSGPLAGADVRATYGQRNGRPTITVVGTGFLDAPGQKSYCMLMGR